MQEVTQSDFPLPTLGAKLTAMREEVRTGRGFQLIRCAPVPEDAPGSFSVHVLLRSLAGIQCHSTPLCIASATSLCKTV